MLKRCFLLFFLLLISPICFAAIIIGNPQGTETLTEVLDYQCAHCHRLQPFINWLIVHDKQLKIRLIPVAIINRDSLIEATSSYVMAKNTSDFLSYHEFLMSKAVSAQGVYQVLNKRHLNTRAFQAAMHQPWIYNEMETGLSLLKAYHSGTPLLLISNTANPAKKIVFKGETDPRKIIRALQVVSHG